jgi:ribonuclease HI
MSRRLGSFTLLTRPTLLRSDYVARIQTDGSFKSTYNISRTAVLYLNSPEKQFLIKTYMNHRNSYESEWASVLDGILYALKKGDGSVELENDNQSVMRALITKTPPVQDYSRFYYYKTLELSNYMDLLSVRWIPRRENQADRLFQLS